MCLPHEVNLPLQHGHPEVAEECLLETPEGLAKRALQRHMVTGALLLLHYREALPFRLTPLSGAARPVRCGAQPLLERPRAYVHLPTASLQLIYDLRLEVPKGDQS